MVIVPEGGKGGLGGLTAGQEGVAVDTVFGVVDGYLFCEV